MRRRFNKTTRRNKQGEYLEQKIVALWLDSKGYLYTATANGARTSMTQAIRLKMSGVKKGVPDLLIFDSPPKYPDKVGTALEMKQEKSSASAVRKEQREWLNNLDERGWMAVVGKGAQDAIMKLIMLGY